MPTVARITCINKTPRTNPHERIQRVGGRGQDGATGDRWVIPESQAISLIESGEWKFWVSAGGESVWVIVATHLGHKYLKTQNDGYQPDNLLALPECPA